VVTADGTPESVTFVRPSFQGDLDHESYLARVPDDALCKGMFFQDILDAARKVSPDAAEQLLAELPRRRYVAFRDYPLREQMVLSAHAVKVLFPGVPSREGMRRLGWMAFPTFMDSMVGRVLFGVLGRDLDRMFEVGPKAFALSLTRGRAKCTRLAHGHWRYEMTDFFDYLDVYYIGVLEGPIRHLGHTPDVRLHLRSPTEATMDIRWK
jgi:uncharacterized protein (TIGR02265 family)